MSWQTVVSVSQVIEPFAVVASVVYLAVEVRNSTRARRAESARAAVAAMRDFNKSMVENSTVARIFRIGAEDRAQLTEDERGQFAHLVFSFFKNAEELHYQFHGGTLAPEVWHSWRKVLAVYATSPGFREYWSKRSILFTPAFRAECDSWEDPGLDRTDQIARGMTRGAESTS